MRLEQVHPDEWRFVLSSVPDELLSAAAHARICTTRPLWLRALPWLRHVWVTVGTTIYAPQSVCCPEDHPSTLGHELIHVRQWLDLGPLLWLVHLAGLPLPVGLAWGRYVIEREAYAWQIRHHGASPERCAEAVASSLYGWAWPRAWALAYFRRVSTQ